SYGVSFLLPTFVGVSHGSLNIDFDSAGVPGALDPTTLVPQSVPFTVRVYAPATAHVAGSVNYVVHVGDSGTKSLSVANPSQVTESFNGQPGLVTRDPASTDVLIGGFGSVTGGFTGSGTLSGVQAGSSGLLSLSFDTSHAGTITGTANLALFSHDA